MKTRYVLEADFHPATRFRVRLERWLDFFRDDYGGSFSYSSHDEPTIFLDAVATRRLAESYQLACHYAGPGSDQDVDDHVNAAIYLAIAETLNWVANGAPATDAADK